MNDKLFEFKLEALEVFSIKKWEISKKTRIIAFNLISIILIK